MEPDQRARLIERAESMLFGPAPDYCSECQHEHYEGEAHRCLCFECGSTTRSHGECRD